MNLFKKICYFALIATSSVVSMEYPLWSSNNDSAESGNSKIHKTIFKDSAYIEYTLGDSIDWPYIVLTNNLSLENQSQDSVVSCMDFTQYDSIKVFYSSNHLGQISMQLLTWDPLYSQKDSLNNLSDLRVLEHPLDLNKVEQIATLAIENFKIPSWWRQKSKAKSYDHRKLLEKTCLLNLLVNEPDRVNKRDTLVVYRWELIKAKEQLAWSNMYLVVLIVLIMVLFLLWFILKMKQPQRTIKNNFSDLSLQKDLVYSGKLEEIEPIPLPINDDWIRIVEYLKKNYHNDKLSIAFLAHELAFSESTLSRIIRKKHPAGFRDLVHGIRLKEAKRMLAESDLQIAEISDNLGYTSPSHFNKVFKEKFDQTPGDYRNSL